MEDTWIGRTIGHYQIVEHLGKGGMAEVYKAYQPALDRYVAVKILHPFVADDETFLARFEREARAVAALRHSHIVRVFDFGREDNTYFMVMEFVDGQTLKQRLNQVRAAGQPLPLDETVRLVGQTARALHHAHGRGLIHRDIKPANILLTSQGEAVLSDFGIAHMMESTRYTMTGVVGTPDYMSPEQGQGQEVTLRTDIYSLGIVLYECLTGRTPFSADTPLAVIFKHVQDPLPMPRSLNPAISEAVERVILKSLAKDPADRFASAEEMAEALQAAGQGEDTLAAEADTLSALFADLGLEMPTDLAAAPDETATVTPETLVGAPETRRIEIAPSRQRRFPWPILLLALIALAVLGAGGYYLLMRPPQETPTAAQSRRVTVAEVSGETHGRPEPNTAYVAVHQGDVLESNSEIQTGVDGHAKLSLDEAILRLAPETQLQVNDISLTEGGQVARFKLLLGRLWGQVRGNIDPTSQFEITIPSGTLQPLEGRFCVSLSADNQTLISVDEGRVRLIEGQGQASQEIYVLAGQQLSLPAGGGPGNLEPISDQEASLWSLMAVGNDLELATPTPTHTATATPTPTATATPTPTHTATPT
ncbi:MAG: protein kinase domain-containing protein, partial [Chloroflexota bacterium]